MTAVRTYDSPPSTLGLYLKAALPALPVVGGLPGIKHEASQAPDTVLARRGVSIDRSHLAAYNEVCGFRLESHVPATYPHMAAFALHMALMTDTDFPFQPMGLVHLRNSITQHRPIAIDEVFDVDVSARNLRPHPKGQLIDLNTEVRIGTEVVWEEVTTLFSRGKRGRGEEFTTPPLDGVSAPSGVVHWRAAADLGRRYGAISGDRNPIHLYPLTAKAFGFPRNIAHGMWTKARCLAALEPTLPAAFRVDVEFRRPILLPSTIVFGSRERESATEFGVTDAKGEKTHLIGKVAPL